jgi:hypothetical protein
MFKTTDSKNVAGVMLIALTIFVLGISEQCFAAPTVYNGVLTVRAGVARAGNLIASGTGTIIYNQASDPTKGVVFVNTDGSYNYTPNENSIGTDSFTFTATDSTGTSAPATVNITIKDISLAANNGTLGTLKNTPKTGKLNATGIGTPLTYNIVTQPSKGTLTSLPDTIGVYTYTPNTDYVGADSFTFSVTDSSGATSSVATVLITVSPANTAPTANSATFRIRTGTGLTGKLTATDTEGDALTYEIVSTGILPVTVSSNGDFIYNPNLMGYQGAQDSFTFKVNDGNLDSQPATVTINFSPITTDTKPAVVPPTTSSYNTTVGAPLSLDLSSKFSDPDGDTLSFIIVNQPTNGNIAPLGNGKFLYIPSDTFVGQDSFALKAKESAFYMALESDLATIIINVVDNTLPAAQNVSKTTPKNTALSSSVMATDADGDNLIYFKVSDPANGTLVFNPDGTYTYTPNTNYNGTDQFTFKAHDGIAYSNIATVTIVVGGLPGDVNGDTKIDLVDAMLALKILAGITPTDTISLSADVNGDNKIGLEELAYILQKAAGLR